MAVQNTLFRCRTRCSNKASLVSSQKTLFGYCDDRNPNFSNFLYDNLLLGLLTWIPVSYRITGSHLAEHDLDIYTTADGAFASNFQVSIYMITWSSYAMHVNWMHAVPGNEDNVFKTRWDRPWRYLICQHDVLCEYISWSPRGGLHNSLPPYKRRQCQHYFKCS